MLEIKIFQERKQYAQHKEHSDVNYNANDQTFLQITNLQTCSDAEGEHQTFPSFLYR